MTLTVVLWCMAAGLAVAAVPVVARMIVGPTILDRAVASDMLVVLVVAGLAIYSAGTGTTYAIPGMLALTGLSFIGTLAVARFVGREDPRRAGLLHRPGNRREDTADGVGGAAGSGSEATGAADSGAGAPGAGASGAAGSGSEATEEGRR